MWRLDDADTNRTIAAPDWTFTTDARLFNYVKSRGQERPEERREWLDVVRVWKQLFGREVNVASYDLCCSFSRSSMAMRRWICSAFRYRIAQPLQQAIASFANLDGLCQFLSIEWSLLQSLVSDTSSTIWIGRVLEMGVF